MTDCTESTSTAYVTPQGTDVWAADAAAQGKTGTQRLLSVDTTMPALAVRAALELPTDGQVVRRRRLVLLDDQPVELATSYYPATIAAGTLLARSGKIRGGAVAALAELGHTPLEVFEQITTHWPDAETADLLQVGEHEPLLVLTRTNRDAAGMPVEYAVNIMVARLSPPLSYRMRTNNA